MKQIRHALKEVEGSFLVTKETGRIYVKAEEQREADPYSLDFCGGLLSKRDFVLNKIK